MPLVQQWAFCMDHILCVVPNQHAADKRDNLSCIPSLLPLSSAHGFLSMWVPSISFWEWCHRMLPGQGSDWSTLAGTTLEGASDPMLPCGCFYFVFWVLEFKQKIYHKINPCGILLLLAIIMDESQAWLKNLHVWERTSATSSQVLLSPNGKMGKLTT